MKYRTFEGRNVEFSEIDHQHLSNIYWFNRIIHGTPDNQLSYITDELKRRFNNVLLSYQPKFNFKQEVQYLERKGCLKWKTETEADVIFNGEIVGKLVDPIQIRDEMIVDILK